MHNIFLASTAEKNANQNLQHPLRYFTEAKTSNIIPSSRSLSDLPVYVYASS